MRVNTFSLDFTELPQRINAYEVHEFIDSKLKLQDDQLLSIATKEINHIKVVTQEIVDNILEVYDDKLKFLSQDGKEYKVIISNESTKQIVKIHRIPLEVPESEIRNAMAYFGTIESITNDMWKNLRFKCYNETKLIRMEMRRPIPSYIIIAGVKYWITYPGQQRTCRKCNSTEHEVKDCDKCYRID
ncbi:hypothetical protein JTB14_026277 [Gonioctena quinquepunctata]|nr:hypothetical protein JTB14_026277 [Gonioctena quinquepunctata]